MKDNWWCSYCAHWVANGCIAGVPWYASSVDCRYYEEPPITRPRTAENNPAAMKRLMKKVLVETI